MFFNKMTKLIGLVLCMTTLYAQADLKLTFSQVKENTNTAVITVAMTNDANESIKVLTWNTPFEKTLNANIFHIINGKSTAVYIGRVVKRLHPTDKDYITLEASETKTINIDLAKYYQLDTKGTYFASYKGDLKAKASAKQIVSTVLTKSNVASIQFSYIPLNATQKKTTGNARTSAKLSPTSMDVPNHG